MKTDRDLLELAAKACGIDAMWSETSRYMHAKSLRQTFTLWNPLLDDGDALRLAVKLQLTVRNEQVASGYTYCTTWDEDDKFPVVYSGENGNKVINKDYAATRRAIVLAAARIGESK
jgi:hypothetical protein